MFSRFVAVALGVLMIAGCAAKALREDEARVYFAHAGEPVREIRAFRLNNWRPLDRDHLVVWRTQSDAYLIKVTGPCTNLEFAHTIKVDYRPPMLRSRFDAILVEGYRCLIDTIRPIDYPKVREVLRQQRS